jgi:hypothetical protein
VRTRTQPYQLASNLMPKPLKIKSVKHLRDVVKRGDHEFFIVLANGFARSSKNIVLDGTRFSVVNEIDDSEQTLTARELFTLSNIGTAITRGCFYRY